MKNDRRDYRTPIFNAFRRKNALHGTHVGTPKLILMAASPHTKHGPRFREDITIFNKYRFNTHYHFVTFC
jgi:hypothetical protein